MTRKNDAAAARKQRLAKALKANIGRRKAAGEPDPEPPEADQTPGESTNSTARD